MDLQEHKIKHINRKGKVRIVVAFFSVGLILSAVLRYLDQNSQDPPQIAGFATLIYVGITVIAAVILSRVGVPMQRLGFGLKFLPWRYLALAAIGVGFIQLFGLILDPLLERFVGEPRNLERFSDIAGSPASLIKLLALNWTLAAFGEELVFRIVLMRGIAFGLGDSRTAFGTALIAQAILFGVIHAYQGPSGIISSGINGLIFGGLTLAARGSIWPAAIAHGASNTIGILSLYLTA